MDINLANERPPCKTLVSSAHGRPRLVTPGEIVSTDASFMRGHGTYMEDDVQVASVAGYIQRVNCLITVTPLRQVYLGSVGDTVVGRITQVQTSRWKVDVNSRLDAELKLANIQLPGGEQRRKNLEDERGMRGLLQEGDLVCVEVQKISDDGLLKLAARTTKFGKLPQGTLISISPSLIVQDKQRIHDLPCGARVIFGANGYVYVSPLVPHDNLSNYLNSYEDVPLDVRETIGRLNNIIKLLATNSIMISPTSVSNAFEISQKMEYEVKDLLNLDIAQDLAVATVQKMNE